MWSFCYSTIHGQCMYFLISVTYMTTKIFVQSTIKPMLVELNFFHHNKIIQGLIVMQIKPKGELILVMKHRISNFIKRLLGSVVNQIAPYWYLAITPRKIIVALPHFKHTTKVKLVLTSLLVVQSLLSPDSSCLPWPDLPWSWKLHVCTVHLN